jgi:hypothetical protein
MHSIYEARTMLGSELSAADQKHVLAAYVYRFTRQRKPQWAREPMPNGNAYPVQFASDADWLAHTRFAVTKTGKLDGRFDECQSSPTWPDNPELRKVAA